MRNKSPFFDILVLGLCLIAFILLYKVISNRTEKDNIFYSFYREGWLMGAEYMINVYLEDSTYNYDSIGKQYLENFKSFHQDISIQTDSFPKTLLNLFRYAWMDGAKSVVLILKNEKSMSLKKCLKNDYLNFRIIFHNTLDKNEAGIFFKKYLETPEGKLKYNEFLNNLKNEKILDKYKRLQRIKAV